MSGISRVQVYKADDGWRWRLLARNGKIVADSAEAYASRSKCVNGWWVVQGAAEGAAIEVQP